MLEHESYIRAGFFIGAFLILAVWEILSPRRVLTTSKTIRWAGNLGIVFLNTAALRILFPLLAINLALAAQEQGWGVLNNFTLPYWLSVIIGIVVFDLIIYLDKLGLYFGR